MFKRTTCINKILSLKKRVRAIQGGTSAGKTFGILPILIDRAIKRDEWEISVVAESIPHLKRGAIKDFKKIMVATGRWNPGSWSSTNSKYTFSNKSYIEFFSVDDEAKLRGARRNDLYMNEANNMKFEAYRQLAKRTKDAIYLDWNPTHDFWYHDELEQDEDVDMIVVTYLDNESCPQAAIDDINMSKEKAFFNPDAPMNKLFEEDNVKNSYWSNEYRVYGLGLKGKLQGTIYMNWSEGEFDESQPYCYGMDFGFNPSPTTLSKVAVNTKSRKIYLDEKLYARNLSFDEITSSCKDIIHNEYDVIVADSAELREINELRKANLIVQPAVKGPDSVRAGIKYIQSFEIIVTPTSLNAKKELNNYRWNDKKSGIPMKQYDHILDAMRYAVDYMSMRKGL